MYFYLILACDIHEYVAHVTKHVIFSKNKVLLKVLYFAF